MFVNVTLIAIVTVDEIENASPELLLQYLADDAAEYNPSEEEVETIVGDEDDFEFLSPQEAGDELLYDNDEEAKDEL